MKGRSRRGQRENEKGNESVVSHGRLLLDESPQPVSTRRPSFYAGGGRSVYS
jgi:hypothetical protein